MTQVRVLEAITPSRIGGAEVFVTQLCRRLPEMGAQVTLFCPKDRPFVNYAAARGVESVNWRTFGKLDPATIIRLVRLIRSRDIDLIHTHLSTASLLGAFAAKLARIPSIAHVHGLNSATCYRYGNRVIAVSEAVKRFLCAQGLDEEKVQVVYNGIDLDAFQSAPIAEVRQQFGWKTGQFVFGVFGRRASVKGQRTAIEAMFVLRQQGVGAKLVIAGDGPDKNDLMESANVLGIGDSVLFAGFVEDVRELMSACDVIAVPSLKEGFGLAAVEAMALERPVVASNVGGLPEIVVPGETGFLCTPGDPAALAQALFELAGDRSCSEQMGKRGRERVIEHFEVRTQTSKLWNVLQDAVMRR